MSFRDELNSIRPDMKMISEQEVYEKFFIENTKRLKKKLKKMRKYRYIRIF